MPFEFTIEGPPVSQQTRRRAYLDAWKARVRAAAQARWPAGDQACNQQVKIIVTYYFDTAAPDVDNIVKPIQDALIGLVYGDDDVVVEAISRKRDLNGTYKVRNMSPLIAQGFVTGKDFLHVNNSQPRLEL